MKELLIGKIVNTHGIKGELRLLSDFEFKEKVFHQGQVIYIGKNRSKETIQSYRHHKIFDMITLKGYSNINEVLKYKGSNVYIDKDSLSLEKDEILDNDIIGFKILVEDIEKGYVKSIRTMKLGNKLLEVSYQDNIVLIPYQKELIKKIDLEKGQIEVYPIEGLFYED